MKKMKLIIPTIFLSIILLFVYTYVVKKASDYQPKTDVVYTRIKINQKTVITSDMLTTKSIDASLANIKAVRKIDDIVGKKALQDIEADEQVLTSKCGQIDEIEDVEIKNKNNRSFTLELKGDQANGYRVKVDQLVDIIFVPTPKGPAMDKAAEELFVGAYSTKVRKISNIRVAAIMDETGALMKNDAKRTVLPKWICFEVTPEQSDFLAYAKGNGRLELATVPNGDK